VVKLEYQGIAIGERLDYVGRYGAEVGKDTQFDCTCLQAELHGLTSVMGHGLRCNSAIAHIETVSGADDDTLFQPLKFRASGGARGQENRDLVGAGERSDASAVITMLVRHQNGINLTCRYASCEQSLFSFFPRKTTVDEEERLACVD
jgi:hypothetical protein